MGHILDSKINQFYNKKVESLHKEISENDSNRKDALDIFNEFHLNIDLIKTKLDEFAKDISTELTLHFGVENLKVTSLGKDKINFELSFSDLFYPVVYQDKVITSKNISVYFRYNTAHEIQFYESTALYDALNLPEKYEYLFDEINLVKVDGKYIDSPDKLPILTRDLSNDYDLQIVSYVIDSEYDDDHLDCFNLNILMSNNKYYKIQVNHTTNEFSEELKNNDDCTKEEDPDVTFKMLDSYIRDSVSQIGLTTGDPKDQ